MEFLIGFGFGWGLGIAFTFQLTRMMWPEQESVWEKHSRFRKAVNQELERKQG